MPARIGPTSRSTAALGILHGVPVTIKINVDYAGRPTTNGVKAFAFTNAEEDSVSVANLRKAGAVIMGRTNVPGFSTRYFTDNDLHGRTLNPWDASRTPGGSSGGAAAAVAAGIGPIGHGNDRAGSVRYPAYACGVTGLRPSLGRVPDFNPSAAEERGLSSQMATFRARSRELSRMSGSGSKRWRCLIHVIPGRYRCRWRRADRREPARWRSWRAIPVWRPIRR